MFYKFVDVFLWPERERERDRERGKRGSVLLCTSPCTHPLPVMSTTYIFPTLAPPAPELTAGPSAPPTARVDPESSGLEDRPPDDADASETADAPAEDQGNLGPVEDPATSRKKGSFYSDRKGRFYTLEWANFAEFDAWRRAEEAANTIEFRASTIWHGGALWTRQRLFVCGRQVTGGGKYTKKNPKQKRKIESKKIGCPCRLLIKIYPHTSIILGNYRKAHNHETGAVNIKYIGVSREARERVKGLLEEKVDRRQVVRKIYFVLF
jgi:hypothetical protein